MVEKWDVFRTQFRVVPFSMTLSGTEQQV